MKIEFTTDNASFENDGLKAEARRILADIASRVEIGQREGSIRDLNGNRIGQWEV